MPGSPLSLMENLSQNERYRLEQAFSKKNTGRPPTPKVTIVEVDDKDIQNNSKFSRPKSAQN